VTVAVVAAPVNEKTRVRAHELAGDLPAVTVVISCFNYARYLRQAVQSAVSQDGVAVDVIIVDDASTDDSLDVARQLSSTYGSVRVLAHAFNQGVVRTFNDGAKAAEGEFLVRLDADDLLTPGSLRRSVALARAYPSVGLVYGHPLHFSGDTLPPPRSKAASWTIWPGREWLRDRCRSGMNVITSPEALMRRSVLDEIGYQAPLKHTHDMELWFRIAAFTDVAYVHGADQAWHRDHSNSMSAREVDNKLDLKERFEAFDVLFKGKAREIGGSGELFRAAQSALVSEALTKAGLELDRGLPDRDLFEYYLAFAKGIRPDIEETSSWHSLRRRAENPASVGRLDPLPFFRRFQGRVRSKLSWSKWHRNGVF
jgi:glycosyltransferase involved in cell wall biosynthesis